MQKQAAKFIDISRVSKMKSVTATVVLGLLVLACSCLTVSASPMHEDPLVVRECKTASELMKLRLKPLGILFKIFVIIVTVADTLTPEQNPLLVENFDAEVNPMCRRICIRVGRTVVCRCV